MLLRQLFVFLFLLLLIPISSTKANEISLPEFQSGSIGKYSRYFSETSASPMDLQQVQQRFQSGPYEIQSGGSLSLGIGVNPVWLQVKVANTNNINDLYRLSVETPWLDYIDVYLVHQTGVVTHYIGGDHLPITEQPVFERFFAVDIGFEPGLTDIYIRVATASVMPIPIQLSQIDAAIERSATDKFQYGFLYGLLISLALYNLVLFFYIKQKEFGLYVLYIVGFVINSLSYTGYLYTYYTTHHGVFFQDYLDVLLMISYSVIGLHFGRTILETKSYAPKLNKFTVYLANSIPFLVVTAFVFGQVFLATLIAFIFNIGFVTLTITLGIWALKAKVNIAPLYLVSTVTAAICIAISTAAVAGLVPLNEFTFKAIESGMAFEGILLAVALAHKFKNAQRDKEKAEDFARTDELTGINNRRGFKSAISPLLSQLHSKSLPYTMLLIDLDKFKSVNDKYGHATGDLVLINTAKIIQKCVNNDHIIARWGGEEFTIFIPNISTEEALKTAEIVRIAIETSFTLYFEEKVKCTASIGVCTSSFERKYEQFNETELFESIISKADKALYEAKFSGRNNCQLYSVDSMPIPSETMR